MKKIQLTQGKFAVVDDADFESVSEYCWHLHRSGCNEYARGYKGQRKGGRLIYMHRLIAGFPDGDVDHVNGSGLDNRRGNLRAASRTLNNLNRKKAKGCYFEERTGKWRSDIWFKGQRIRLGRFDTEDQAHKVYLAKKQELMNAKI